MTTQLDIFQPCPAPSPGGEGKGEGGRFIPPNTDAEKLRAHLHCYGWRTRAQICEALGWSERQVRSVAESLGADVVRSQSGFKLTEALTREDLPAAQQAADAYLSQGKRMIRYSIALRRHLHTLIG